MEKKIPVNLWILLMWDIAPSLQIQTYAEQNSTTEQN